MNKSKVLILTVLGLWSWSLPCFGFELEMEKPPDKFGPSVADIMIVRPLSAIGAVVTTSAFIATLPVTYPLGKDLKMTSPLVEKPWNYAADRPLGVFLPEKSACETISEQINGHYKEYLGRVSADRAPLDIK
jgi:hypothetical protein